MCMHFFAEARDLLRKWRDDNERKSEDVIDLFISCIGSNMNKLGDESKQKTILLCIVRDFSLPFSI